MAAIRFQARRRELALLDDELAAFVPVAWEGGPAIHSKDVASVHNPWMGAWDLNLTGLR